MLLTTVRLLICWGIIFSTITYGGCNPTNVSKTETHTEIVIDRY